MKALHLGCEKCLIDGWINTDIKIDDYLSDEDKHKVLILDAEGPFPYNDNEFDFIYSEHLIEHLSYCGFKNYIRECYRCLKPGGVLRTACPYLDFYIDLWNNPHEYEDFIQHHCEMFNKELLNDWKNEEYVPPMFILNDNMRMWNHQVMYDKNTLIKIFKKTFNNVKQCEYQKSDYKELQNLEHDNKRGHDENVLETIIFECVK